MAKAMDEFLTAKEAAAELGLKYHLHEPVPARADTNRPQGLGRVHQERRRAAGSGKWAS